MLWKHWIIKAIALESGQPECAVEAATDLWLKSYDPATLTKPVPEALEREFQHFEQAKLPSLPRWIVQEFIDTMVAEPVKASN